MIGSVLNQHGQQPHKADCGPAQQGGDPRRDAQAARWNRAVRAGIALGDAEELLARLRVTLRRLNAMQSKAGTNEQSVFINGDLKIDYAAGCVYMCGEELHVTPIEYKLLCLLAKNIGKVLTHTFITKEIWGSTWENDVASLRVFMAALRKKMEKASSSRQYIQTHIGVGYRMLKLE